MDVIRLNGIECRCRIGVPAEERRKPQKIVIDVALELDIAAAAAKDDFRLTADYWAVEKAVRQTAEKGERQLAETLAEQVARRVLACDKKIASVSVAVRKKPAVMPRTREVVVEITRRR